MKRAYLFGARLAARCSLLVMILWLASALFGVGFALASGRWLGDVLDGSLATRTLLYDLDPNVFIDIYHQHDSGFRMLIAMGVLMGSVYMLLWCWLHGVVIFKARTQGRMSLDEAFRRGVDVAPRMVQLMLLAATFAALFTALLAAAVWWAASATLARSSEIDWYCIAGGACAAWLLGYVLLVAIHDHARIRLCSSDEGAVRSYLWAVGFVLHGGERAFPLAVLLNLTALAFWAVYQVINTNIPVTEGVGMTSLILWGEVFLWVRMYMRVWFFGAQSDLQSLA